MKKGVIVSLSTGGSTEAVQPTTVEVGKNTGGGLIVPKGHIVIPGRNGFIVGVGCLAGGIINRSGCFTGIVAGGDFTVIARVWIQG